MPNLHLSRHGKPRKAAANARSDRWFALVAFTAMVLLMGGASRHDVQSLVFLRPFSFGFVGYALWVASKEELKRLPLPFYLLLALAALIGLQLIPLPFDWWSRLPGREIIAEIGRADGLPEVARPLTLAPSRTWNALFALVVPIAAFLLFVIQDRGRRVGMLWLLVGAGVGSILLGILQSFGGADSALYTYSVHTEGQPVGLFANRNHQGVFLAAVSVLAALLIHRLQPEDEGAGLKATALVSLLALSIPFVLILGSRAGLLLMLLAMLVAPILLASSPVIRRLLEQGWRKRGKKARFLKRPILLATFYATAAALAVLAIVNSRDEALSRLGDTGDAMPLDRDAVLPYLVQIARDYLPLGSGFGSFDRIFFRYESTEHLSTFYLNQAHNDWLQLLIEGGVPAVALLAVAIGWVVAKVVVIFRRSGPAGKREVVGVAVMFVVVALGSAVDYPMRVPIFMMTMAYLVCLLSDGLAEPTRLSPQDLGGAGRGSRR